MSSEWALGNGLGYRQFHDGFLVGFRGFQFPLDAAFVHHIHTVRHAQHFRQFRRNHDDAVALGHKVIHDLVDFIFGTHINAACGLVNDQQLGLRHQAPGQHHFLLVATTQIAHDLATVLFSASDFAMGTLRNCLVWFTRIPFHEISLKLCSIAWALLLTVVLGALCFYPKHTVLYFKHILMRSFLLFRVFLKQWSIKKRRFKIVCVQVFLLVIGGFVAIWLWLPQVNQPRVQARLIAFPSGEGLSFFIQLNDFNVLFDNGRYFRGIETAKRVILPSFEYFKVKKLDHMILSIDNNQHIGGTKTIRTAFSDVKITAHHTLTRYIDDAFDCANDEDLQKIVADYFSNHPSNLIKYTDARVHGDFAIKALPVLSSCGLDMRIGRYNIWLLSDISIKEWSYLTDLLMQKVLTVPDIILMPKQGRSRGFILSKALKEQPDLLIILSTRQVNAQLIEEINTHHINALNANDGMIILDLSKDKLQYKQDKISDRHWWLG